MNIHEYQAKELLAKFGVPVPAGHAAMSVEEAVEAANKLPGPLWVVKAQIHAGGRGKGKFKELGEGAKGGVRLAKSVEEVRANAEEMLGRTLVTIQTGPAGKQVEVVRATDFYRWPTRRSSTSSSASTARASRPTPSPSRPSSPGSGEIGRVQPVPDPLP